MKNKILIYFPDTGGYNFTPPYEILFQARALENSGYSIILADSRTDDVYKIIEEQKNDIFLAIISTLIKYTSITITRQYPDGLKVAEYAKSKTSAEILWTGLAASILTNNILAKQYNDFVLTGLSDNTICRFVNSLEKRETFAEIKSLVFKGDEGIITNSKDKLINPFIEFGNFDISKIDLKPYIHNNSIDYIASVGCINSCSFCSVPSIYCQHWYHNEIDNILDHIKYILGNYPEIRIIHFRDDNFLVNKVFTFDLFSSLKNENIKFIWSAQTSVNVLKTYKEEELALLKEYGCGNISIGIESGDEYILTKATKSKTSKDSSISTIQKLLFAKITVSITSIISFPYNNQKDYKKTLKFLIRLKLLYPKLSMYCTVLQPIPGTEIFKEIFQDKDFSEDLLSNNTWTSKNKKEKLKKFESFYFIFDQKHFYKTLPENLSKDLKSLNKFYYPFIKLRFKLGCTSFLWEYFFAKNKLKRIKEKNGIDTSSIFSEVGIRHLTSNYEFGFKTK